MFTCSFCGTVLEDSSVNPSAPTSTSKSTPQLTIVTGWTDATSLPSYAGARRVGGVVVAIILLSVAGIIAAAVFAVRGVVDDVASVTEGVSARGSSRTGESAPFGRETIHHAELVRGAEANRGALVAITGSDALTLRYLDLDEDGPLQWQSQLPINRSTDFGGFVVTDDAIYTTVGDHFFGWNRASGERSFATRISDSVKRYCADCIQVIDDVVVVLSGDGVLSGRNTTTGDEMWSITLAIEPRQVITLPGMVGVIDAVDERTHVLRWFDPTTGLEQSQVPLGCGAGSGPFPASTLRPFDYLVPLPDGLVWQSTSIITSCAVRWVHGEDGYRWDTPVPDGSPASNESREFLVVGDRVLAPDRDGVRSYDIDTGSAVLLTKEQENLTLLGAGDGLIYLASESTRGSRRWSIVAVDPVSAERLWSVEMTGKYGGGDRPKLLHTGWYAEPIDGGVAVATYDEDEDTLKVQVLSTAGQWSDSEVVSLDKYSTITWPQFFGTDGTRLIVQSGATVLVIDLATGSLLHEWN